MGKLWMVVEDDPVIRSILAAELAKWGVQPLLFEDGHQVWEWLNLVKQGSYHAPLPDVVLLDTHLPGPQGPEIGRRMRHTPATARIPIIAMAPDDISDHDQARIRKLIRPDLLLTKPLPPPVELRALVERAMASRRSH